MAKSDAGLDGPDSGIIFLWTKGRNFPIQAGSCIVGGGFFRVELASSN